LGNNATQATAANQPTYSSNGVSFNGSSTILPLTKPDFIANRNFTFFVVERRTSNKNTNYFIGGSGVGNNLHVGYNNNSGADRPFVGFFSNDFTGTTVGSTLGITRIFKFNLTPSGRTIVLNGTLNGSDASSTKLLSFTGGSIGASSTLGYYQGNILEVICYTSTTGGAAPAATTADQDQQVEGYLAWKWGLVADLPAGHPYKNVQPFGFSPTSVDGCQLWLDAADITKVSLNVTGWNDKSGNGANAVATGNPTYEIANRRINVVSGGSFSGSGISIPAATAPLAPSLTGFAVVRTPTNLTGVRRIWTLWSGSGSDYNTPSGLVLAEYNTNIRGFRNSATNNTGSVPVNTLGLLTTTLGNTPSNGTLAFSINGNTSGEFYGTYADTGGQSALNQYLLGISSAVGGAWGGMFHEFLLFNTALTTAQRQQVEGYLGWKWGLQSNLPDTHPFTLANYFFNNTRPLTRNFVPPDIEGCQLWIDAADQSAVLTSVRVSQWSDKSTNANHAVQSDANSRPTYSAERGISFNGSLTLPFAKPDFVVNTNFTFFVVERRTAPANPGNYFLGGSGSTANSNLHVGWNNDNPAFRGFASDMTGALRVLPYTTPVTRIWKFNIKSDNVRELFINGTLSATSTPASKLTSNPNSALGGAYLGRYIGDILEMICYTNATGNATTIDQDKNVEGYLGAKWGITSALPAGHPNPVSFDPLASSSAESGSVCSLWLDSSDFSTITLESGAPNVVTTVLDKSGLGNNVNNAGSTITNTSTLNSLPVLTFPAAGTANTNFLKSLPISRDTVNHSMFYVARYPSSPEPNVSPLSFNANFAAANGSINTEQLGTNRTSGSNSSGIFQLLLKNSTNGVDNSVISTNYNASNNSASNVFGSSTFVVGCVRQGANYVLTTNGRPLTQGANGHRDDTPLAPMPNVTNGIYNIVGGTQGLQIGEVIAYNTGLSPGDRQIIEGYLMWKWGVRQSPPTFAGLRMETTHPFYTIPPTTETPSSVMSKLYKRNFDVSDLSPDLWLDAQDLSTLCVGVDNRVTQWRNKGTNSGLSHFSAPLNVPNSANLNVTNGNTSSGTLEGPLFTESTLGNGCKLRYLDFSTGGSFPVTAGSIIASGTATNTTASSYNASTGVIVLAGGTPEVNQGVAFRTNTFGGLTIDTIYFVRSVTDTRNITISDVYGGGALTLTGAGGSLTSVDVRIYPSAPVMELTLDYMPSVAVATSSSTITKYNLSITGGSNTTDLATVYFTPQLGIPYPPGSDITIASTTNSSATVINGNRKVVSAGSSYVTFTLSGATAGNLTANTGSIEYQANTYNRTLTFLNNDRQLFLPGQNIVVGATDTDVRVFNASTTSVHYFSTSATEAVIGSSISLKQTPVPTMTDRQVSLFFQNASFSNGASAQALGAQMHNSSGANQSGIFGIGTPYIVKSQTSNRITLQLKSTITIAQIGTMSIGAGTINYGNITVTSPYLSAVNFAIIGTPSSTSANLRTSPFSGSITITQYEVGQTIRITNQSIAGCIGNYYISAVSGNNIITIDTPLGALPAGAIGQLFLQNLTMPHGCVGISKIDITGTTAKATLSLAGTASGTLFGVNSRVSVSGSSTAELNGIKTVTASDTTSVSWTTSSTGSNILGGIITADDTWDMAVTSGNAASTTAVTLNFTTQSFTPFSPGTLIRVTGVTPSAYNGTWYVTSGSTSAVSFLILTSSIYSSGGNIFPVNRRGYISPTSGTISSGSTTATINYTSLPIVPFVVGQPIHITGSTETTFNGTYNVVTATTSSLTYSIPTAPGSTLTLAGSVNMSPALFRISSSTVSGSGPFTVTITYVQADGTALAASGGTFTAAQTLQITGSNVAAYNGNWTVLASPAPTHNTVSFSSTSSLTGINTGNIGIALPLTIGTLSPHGLSANNVISFNVTGSSSLSGHNMYTTASLDKYTVLTSPTTSTFQINPLYQAGSGLFPLFSIGPVLCMNFAAANNFPVHVMFPAKGYCLEFVGSNTVVNTSGVTIFGMISCHMGRLRGSEVFFASSRTANTHLADVGTYGVDNSDFGLGYTTFGVPRIQALRRTAGQGILNDVSTDKHAFRLMTSSINMSPSAISDVPAWSWNSSTNGWRNESIFKRDSGGDGLYTSNLTYVISNITFSGSVATVTAYNTSFNYNIGGYLGNMTLPGLPVRISGVTPTVYNQDATILSSSPTPTNISGVITFGYTVTGTPATYQFGGTVSVNLTAVNFISGHMRVGAPPNANASFSFTNSGTLLNNGFFSGGISELIIFNKVLSIEQRQLVEGYLTQKHSTQVYTGGSSVIIPPTSITITGGSSTSSGTGWNVTVTFASQSANPINIPSLITISSATPSAINGTWAVIGGNGITSLTFFYPPATQPTNPSAGTIAPTVCTNGSFIHPYRLGSAVIAGRNTLSLTSTTETYAQNLVAWFDAANPNLINNANITTQANGTPPTNDTAVTSWAPASGWWANTPLQLANPVGTVRYYSTTADKTRNGLPGIYVAGSTGESSLSLATSTGSLSQYMTINTNSNFTWTVVFRPDSDASATTPVLSVTNGTSNRLMLCSDGTLIYSNGTTSQTLTPTTVLSNTKTHMITVYRDGSTLGYRIVSEDTTIGAGGFLAGTSVQINLLIPTFSNPTLTFGAIGVTGYTRSFTGSIFEATLFRSALSIQAIQQVEGYLAWKWGLQASLPTTHAYKKVYT
jgi:hypothetical protein